MVYQYKDLSVLAYANGFTLWHYTTQDSLPAAITLNQNGEEVTLPNPYFNAAEDVLKAGDLIIANVETATTPKAALLLIVDARNSVVIFHDMSSPNTTCCGK